MFVEQKLVVYIQVQQIQIAANAARLFPAASLSTFLKTNVQMKET